MWIKILISAIFLSAATFLFLKFDFLKELVQPPPPPPPPVEEKNLPSDEDHAEIEKIIASNLGEEIEKYACYVFRPQKELTPVIFQSRKMKPASMIKVFVLAKAMQDIKDGKLSLDEKIVLAPENVVGGAGSLSGEGYYAEIPARTVLEHMIAESDNTATNMMIDRLGGLESINEYLKAHGYADTEMQHKMMMGESYGLSNYSSVKDLGTIFTKIYKHECVDEYYDKIMIEYLLKQEDTDCFPSALPNWRIAHKTGEVLGSYHDGGICYGKDEDFIIVIMINDYYDRQQTITNMQNIARQISQLD